MIGAGERNTISGTTLNQGWNVIAAGCNNTIVGEMSGILGGCGSILTHNNSFIVTIIKVKSFHITVAACFFAIRTFYYFLRAWPSCFSQRNFITCFF